MMGMVYMVSMCTRETVYIWRGGHGEHGYIRSSVQGKQC